MNRQTEERILSACGRIITESGPVGISIEKLYEQPDMAGIDHSLFRQDEEIFNMILLHFEKKLKEIVEEISTGRNDPVEEFEMLFKALHKLFLKKLYYLEMIYDKDLQQQYSFIEIAISRIKSIANDYLYGLIDRGKEQDVFTINAETKVLVKEILGSFQELMNDMQLTDKMLRDVKKYRTVND